MKKILIVLSLTVYMSLSMTACPPPPETTGPEPGTKEYILKEIEDNWRDLGYTEKPVKYMALTYDDGPSTGTEELLAVFAEKKVRVTFFLIGKNVKARPDIVRKMRDAGHELANHSYNHQSMGGYTPENCKKEIQDCTDAIFNATNDDGNPVTPRFFRAPNLSTGKNLFDVCTELELPLLQGSLSNDYNGGANAGNAQNQANAIVNGASEWLIALNHDPASGTKANILEAAELMIDGLRAKGYYILTASEMLIMKEGTVTPGKVYNNFKTVP